MHCREAYSLGLYCLGLVISLLIGLEYMADLCGLSRPEHTTTTCRGLYSWECVTHLVVTQLVKMFEMYTYIIIRAHSRVYHLFRETIPLFPNIKA